MPGACARVAGRSCLLALITRAASFGSKKHRKLYPQKTQDHRGSPRTTSCSQHLSEKHAIFDYHFHPCSPVVIYCQKLGRDGKSLVEALDIRCYRSAASPNCTSMARGLHCCCADNHWNTRWTQGSTMRPHWLRRLWAWTMPRFFGGVYFKGQLARGLPLQNKHVQIKMEMPIFSTNKVLIYPLPKPQVEVKRRI